MFCWDRGFGGYGPVYTKLMPLNLSSRGLLLYIYCIRFSDLEFKSPSATCLAPVSHNLNSGQFRVPVGTQDAIIAVTGYNIVSGLPVKYFSIVDSRKHQLS